MRLPLDKVLCPSLQCTVNDNIFMGASQPIIGNFEVPLGELLFERNEIYQANLGKLQKLEELLENHLNNNLIPDYGANKSNLKPFDAIE